MARLKQVGFELNTTGNTEGGGGSDGTSLISSSVLRTGTYATIFTSFSSGSAKDYYILFASSDNNGPLYTRCYLYVATRPSAENRIISLCDDQFRANTNRVYITHDNSGTLKLYDEDGQITGTTTISTATWYRIEMKVDLTAGAGSHVVEAMVDGVSFASASNRSISTGFDYFWVGGNLGAEAQTTGSWSFDDIAINDSSGSFQNSYPGQGKIIHLRPNAAGDNTAWTGAYTDVDEVTPDDTTTKLSSNTLDQIEDMNIDSPSMLGDQDTINVVAVGVRYNGAGASANASFVLRIKAAASGTVEESSAIAPTNATWVTNANAAPRNYPLVLYDLPGASTTAWTKNDLENTQIGVRLSATSTNAAQVSTLWLSVDYTPVTVKKWGVKPR